MQRQYGENVRNLFPLDPKLILLNNGSFGLPPHVVTEKRFELIREQISNSDAWFCGKSEKLYNESIARLAEFLHADPEDIALVDNVTTGINVILKSFNFQPHQKILLTKHCYEGVRRNIDEHSDYDNIEQVLFPVELPIESVEKFLEKFEAFVGSHSDISMALIEHIASPSAIVFPIKQMITILKKQNIFTAIDGAHAPGQLNLNLPDIGADFYSANLHKWCFTSLSCGFFWVAKKHKKIIRPLVTSHFYQTDLQKPFEHPGTRDLSAFYTIPTALNFIDEMGGVEGITGYVKQILHEAKVDLCDSLPLKELQIPDEMKSPCFLMLELPEKIINAKEKLHDRDQWASVVFFDKQNVRVFFSAFNNKAFVRISASIYNCKKDFEALKQALKELFLDPSSLKLTEW